MAKLKHTQILHFCSDNEHVSTETVSTDIFKLKCRLHMLVYLFTDAKDDVFVTHHYYVSTFFFRKNHIEHAKKLTYIHYTVEFFFISLRMWTGITWTSLCSTVHVVRRNFSRGTKLNDIRDHLVRCSTKTRTMKIIHFIILRRSTF